MICANLFIGAEGTLGFVVEATMPPLERAPKDPSPRWSLARTGFRFHHAGAAHAFQGT